MYPDVPDDEANKKIAAERKARKYNVRVLILRRGTRLTLSRRYRERLAPFLLE